MDTFVRLLDTDTSRVSSIYTGDAASLRIVGVLNHNSNVQPASVEDARRLIEWLTEWIAK